MTIWKEIEGPKVWRNGDIMMIDGTTGDYTIEGEDLVFTFALTRADVIQVELAGRRWMMRTEESGLKRVPLPETAPERAADGYGRCLPPCQCLDCGRPRTMAQMLIAEIGSVGPEKAEDTVARACVMLARVVEENSQ